MNKHFTYQAVGTCCKEISFDLIDGILHNVELYGGCAGNTAGIGRLVEGMSARDVYVRTKGIPCGPKTTSCPDQLACAIKACCDELGETL